MRIKKIALVETKAVKTHIFSRRYLPRLGLPMISGVLKQAGYSVELFLQEQKPLDLNYLMEFDLVGISSITSTVPEAFRIGRALKERGMTVVMGGPHVSAEAEEALTCCDYVVRGEGEIVFMKLLDKLNNGRDVADVPSISYIKNGGAVHNTSTIEKVDLTTLPDTDFSICKGFAGPQEYPAQIMFSRGCPYDCNFCSVTTMFGRKYRHRTNEQVIRDLEPFTERTISFIDDNFAANPKKTKELLRMMIESKTVPMAYSCQIRINAARDEELLGLMRKTNCRIAYVGLESVDPATLKQYHKGQTLEQIISAIKVFRKYNIGLHGMFVLGGENDTVGTIKSSVDFSLKTGLDTIQLCALTPFPGTAVHDEMTRANRVLHRKWELYDGLHVVIQPNRMTPYELQLGIMEGMKRFYSMKNVLKFSLRKRWRSKYRMGGRYLVNRWIAEKQSYLEYLKNTENQVKRADAVPVS
ncbi:MAG: B12-binding domain-containing radical SAM protein [bacterium]|nr:MAG: B12-binding domain-containing radical SAM protein [bacterium]